MHNALLLVIVSFGLLFTGMAALAMGLSLSLKSPAPPPWRGRGQLTVMLLLSNFVVMPALFIGLAAIISFNPQVKMAIVALSLMAGAPFIPWLVSLAKGNLAYSGFSALLLTLVTFIVSVQLRAEGHQGVGRDRLADRRPSCSSDSYTARSALASLPWRACSHRPDTGSRLRWRSW